MSEAGNLFEPEGAVAAAGDERSCKTKAIKALHVVAGLYQHHGGPAYTVPRLCQALAANGVTPTLYSIGEQGGGASDVQIDGYRDRRFSWNFTELPVLGSLRWSRDFGRALDGAVAVADVIHNHGLWLMPNVQSGWAAARAGKPFIVTPRGMLSDAALTFSRWKKRAFWRLLQGSVVRRAACLHVTSEQEYDEVRTFGLCNPVAVIPNGIDLPDPVEAERPHDRIVLTLGRIHPKKGLPSLLRAWAGIEAAHPAWRLRIVGPAEMGHDGELRHMASELGLRRVSIEGPVYGPAKDQAYRDADVFVLPTLNENFGITVAEALAAGTPVISTKGAPWQGLETHGCGWWIEHGEGPLTAALESAMAMPREALARMGANGRGWMQRDFSWNSIAAQMHGVYRWLVRAEAPPPTVRFD